MITRAAQYEEVDVANVDITGAIYPLRAGPLPVGEPLAGGACVMKAEDLAFLFEALLERAKAVAPERYALLKEAYGKVDLRPRYRQYTDLLGADVATQLVGWINRDLDLGGVTWPADAISAGECIAWLLDGFRAAIDAVSDDELYTQIKRTLPLQYLYYDVGQATRWAPGDNSSLLALSGTTTIGERGIDGWHTETRPWESGTRGWTYLATSLGGQLESEVYSEMTLAPALPAAALVHLAALHLIIVAATYDGGLRRIVRHRIVDATTPTRIGRADAVAAASEFGFSPSQDGGISIQFTAEAVVDFAFPAEINSINWQWSPDGDKEKT